MVENSPIVTSVFCVKFARLVPSATAIAPPPRTAKFGSLTPFFAILFDALMTIFVADKSRLSPSVTSKSDEPVETPRPAETLTPPTFDASIAWSN